jgi:hypothetical protein
MATSKYWELADSQIECRATCLSGQEAQQYSQNGYRRAWVVMFYERPPVTAAKNLFRYTDRDGFQHWLTVKNFTNEAEHDRFWVAECDELTQKPVVVGA